MQLGRLAWPHDPSRAGARVWRAAPRRLLTGLAAVAAAACQSGERAAQGDAAAGAPAAAPAPPPSVATAPAAAGAAPTDPQLVALGDSIFHGQAAGGTCVTCHGQRGEGSQIGPNLTDAEWLHGDGGYQFIVNTVTTGVPSPKKYPAAMPPMGGAQLTPDQVRAVAAYVYSVSRRGS